MEFEGDERIFQKPNGGYGWIILLSISLTNFILIGCMYSFGIILKILKEHFNVTQDVANLLQSFNTGFLFASGALSSALAKEFGCRKVMMLSSFIYASTFFISAFLSSFYLITIMLGIIGGIAYGCTYLTSIIILVDYFDKKLGLANGIMMASSGFGAFAFAPLTKFLTKNFVWNHVLLINGSIILTIVLFSSFLTPVEYYKKKHTNNAQLMESLKLNENYAETIPKDKPNILIRILKEITNFSLLKENFAFLLIVSSGFFVFAAYYIPFIYIPIRAQELEIHDYAWVISIAGLANIPNRLILGIFCDKKVMKPVNMNTICLLIAAFCLFCYFYLKTFALQICFGVVFAIPMAGVHSLSTPYLVEIVGSNKFRNANGILNTMRGIGAVLGPFFAGMLSERFNSIFYSFIFAGSSFLIAVVFSFFAGISLSAQKKNTPKNLTRV
ncbi:monocarboxylate transporter 3-like [Brachionus plicatilis]|uniref:Monocarboxylate transporter 3-like n=1 Tax=Brachionus plicatilis TaxID=10195 RepID=A0A3M7S766_BRAPC|nr:monocarboxylate transporter 3-like [Brachionus plicatilis]